MTIDAKEYHAWATTYLARFGINSQAGDEMMLVWLADFNELGATLAELRETERRVGWKAPRFLSEHRETFFSHLRCVIRERRKREPAANGREEATVTAEEVRKFLKSVGWKPRKKSAKGAA